jgi:hypothetical protein
MADPRRVNLDEQAKIGSCTTIILADDAVTNDKIAPGAVTGESITPGTVTADLFHPDVFGEGLVYNSLTNSIDVNIDLNELEISLDTLNIKDGGVKTVNIDINADLSFNNHQALELRIENATSDPVPGNVGRLIWRTDTGELKIDTGTAFINAGGHNIEDESVLLPQRPILNFIGTGVTVTDTGTKTQVDVRGTFYARQLLTVASLPGDYTIVLLNTPLTGSEVVSWNGLLLRRGPTNDYTISGTTITINPGLVLTIGDEIQIIYAHE